MGRTDLPSPAKSRLPATALMMSNKKQHDKIASPANDVETQEALQNNSGMGNEFEQFAQFIKEQTSLETLDDIEDLLSSYETFCTNKYSYRKKLDYM
jgi:hypothetical protein